MRLKLDENLGRDAAEFLSRAGHDVATVHGQRMCGAIDTDLIARCRDEERSLVTMDAEFGNPLVFPPHRFRGIVLIRVPPPSSGSVILQALRTFAGAVGGDPALRAGPDRGLWIVQPGRVRVYQPSQPPDVA